MSKTEKTALEAFLADNEKMVARQLYDVPLDLIHPDPGQPRKHFSEEALNEMTASIKRHGVLQPVIFRKDEVEQFILVAGERRFRASQQAGKKTIPAIYNEGENTAEIALVENLLRENLTPIEEAEALLKLKEEQSYTNEQLSSVIGKASSTISEILSLTKLPESIKEECRSNPKYSRRSLVEVAKKDTDKKKEALFKKLQENELKSDDVRAETRKSKKVKSKDCGPEAVGRTAINLPSELKDVIAEFYKAVADFENQPLSEVSKLTLKLLNDLVKMLRDTFPETA